MKIRSCSFAALLFLALIPTAWAQSEKRAFIVGINDYDNIDKLQNAEAGANAIAKLLKQFGFAITLLTKSDPEDGTVVDQHIRAINRTDIQLAFGRYVRSLKEEDQSVVYFGGHGVELRGASYLVPADVPKRDDIVDEGTLTSLLMPLSEMIGKIRERDVVANVWIVDACRENPFRFSGAMDLGGKSGLGSLTGLPGGAFVFYAAEAGQKAYDRLPEDPPTQRQSIFVRAFTEVLAENEHNPIQTVGWPVQVRVFEVSKHLQQRVGLYQQMIAPWCFGQCRGNNYSVRFTSKNFATLASADALFGDQNDIERELARKQAQREALRAASNVTILQGGKSGRLVLDASVLNAFRRAEKALAEETVQLAEVLAAKDSLTQNAVFLGKLSSASTCKEPSEVAPFGCETLRKLLSRNARSDLLSKDLAAVASVSIRARAPTVDEKLGALYSCVVKTISPAERIRINGIVDVSTGDEIFFWGIVDSPQRNCLR